MPAAPPRLSPWATAVYAVLWALLMVDGAADRVGGNPLALLSYPSASGARLASRDLEAAQGAEAAPAGERWVWDQLEESAPDALEAGAGVHRDLLEFLASGDSSPDERDFERLRLALWLLATGDGEGAAGLADEFEDLPEAAAGLRSLAASSADPGPAFWSLARMAEPRLADRLRADWERRAGEVGMARSLDAKLEAHARHRYRRARRPLEATAGLIALGLACAGALASRHRGASTLAPPPWSLGLGIAVLVRGDFWNRLFFAVLSRLPAGAWEQLPVDFLWSWGTLFASLPLAWLVARHLYRPHRGELPRPFGLAARGRDAGRLAAIALAALSFDLLGAYALSWSAYALGFTGHWSEGLDETLAFGDRRSALLVAIDYGLWTPLFEELAFRGVLFLSLRRILGNVGAALASALVFGAVHFYSLPGLAATTWSGFVWAIAFSRSKSLWPSIGAHSLYNLLYVAGQIALYR